MIRRGRYTVGAVVLTNLNIQAQANNINKTNVVQTSPLTESQWDKNRFVRSKIEKKCDIFKNARFQFMAFLFKSLTGS